MKKYLTELNPEQLKVVQTTSGPLMVLAGPGSGKTKTIVAKIIYLIDELKVEPWKILAMTFSNRAANEMKERVHKALPETPESALSISTFHSYCARILRQHGAGIGLKNSFTIYDDSESGAVIKQILKNHEIDPKKTPPTALAGFIEKIQNEGYYPKRKVTLSKDLLKHELFPLYLEYVQELSRNNAVDFGGLITRVIELLETNEEVKNYYNNRFEYLLIDEYQDTNKAQFELIRLFTLKHKNVCVVGDEDQCLIKGTKVLTPTGEKNIEKLTVGEEVLSYKGKNNFKATKILKIHKNKYEGSFTEITTVSGKVLTSTDRHIHFSGYSKGLSSPRYLVYLMYRKDFGFRIGLTQIYKNENKLGFFGRLRSERANRIWILETFDNELDARIKEEELSLKFSIPTVVFQNRSNKYSYNYNEYIKQIYSKIDSNKNGKKLLKFYKLNFEYGFMNKGSEKKDKKCLITMFSGTKNNEKTAKHRLSINGSCSVDLEKLINAGIKFKFKRKNHWCIERSSTELNELYNFYNKISKILNLVIEEKALINNNSFYLLPASHLRPGMIVGTKDGNEEIKYVKNFKKTCEVFDLDIENSHNYIANGILTHNSIYSWRGAEIKNILDFEKTYPDTKTFHLGQNYRSTSHIVSSANEIIQKNVFRKGKKIWTTNEEGEKIKVYQCNDGNREALFIAQTVSDLLRKKVPAKEIAIFYRTNSQSRLLEDAFRKFLIPYQVIGGQKFYERKEVKDMVAYLQVLSNPQDEVSMNRIINFPSRGLGDKTIDKLINFSRDQGIGLWEFLVKNKNKPSIFGGNKAQAGVLEFINIVETGIKYLSEGKKASEIYDMILEKTNYIELLRLSKKYEDQARIENLQELKSSMAQFETMGSSSLTDYLETITLDRSEEPAEGGKVSLMTIHASKGLEFEQVFLAGCEETIFPSPQSLNEGLERAEEERRLFYVAITRAKKQLYILHALTRMIFGKTSFNPPSRFLMELPKERQQKFRV